MLRKVFVLVISLLATIMTTSAQTPPNNEIWYTTTDGETISKSFDADDLVSHNYNNGRGVLKFRNSVTRIEDCAFYGCSSLTSITIPNSVTRIEDGAFEGCCSLTSITIGNSITSIGRLAFYDCSSLKSFKGKYASIDGRCFIKDGELITYAPAGLTSYTIPNSVTIIGEGAFWDCSSLTSITIPDSVTEIGGGAFYNCSSLTSITIPNSVTEIGNSAFYGCSSLTSITIPNSVTSIEYGAFYNCSSLTSIIIPNSVTSIEYGAFEGCSSLTSITIPNSVTLIEDRAFRGCSCLTSITIGNSVTSIGEYAFYGCSSLKSFKGKFASEDGRCLIKDGKLIKYAPAGLTSYTIPNGLTSIGNSAFNDCSSLTSITIPNSVTSIGGGAFYNCSSLTSITIPNSVTSIGEVAFYGCSSLKSVKGKYASSDGRCLIIDGKLIAYAPAGLTSYTIPNSVTRIEDGAFAGCSSLTSITIPESVTSIGEWAFAGCSSLESFAGKFASSDGRCLIKYGELIAFAPARVTSYTIPDSVTSIGEWAFEGCSSLTSITIPNSVTRIEDGAFRGCSSLTSITIPEGITSIGWYAFENCSSLTSITIPDSVISIGGYAFSGCSSLTSITIPEGVTSIENGAFRGCSSLTSITTGNSVTSIEYESFSGYSSLKSVKVSNKYCYDYFKKLGVSNITFMISTLEEYEEAQKLGATKITIDSKYASEDGLCLIDNGKLILFIGKDLTEYTIPESVTSIGDEAFEGCSGLKSVKIANKYCYDYFKDKVADIAFYGANASPDGRCLIINSELIQLISHGLKEYVIPNSITKISSGALSGCNNLQSISIPNSVTSIGREAFAECTALQHIDVGCNLKLIDNNTLGQISSITLLKGVSNVAHLKQFDNIRSYKGECASSDGRCLIDNGKLIHFINDNITRYAIPQGVTHVGENVFGYMHNLTLITIPDSVTSIGEGAFYGCSGLTSITIPENVTWIGDNALNCYNLESITCKAMAPPTISFPGIGDKVIIYVPKDAVKAYKKDTNWMQYSKRIKRIKE